MSAAHGTAPKGDYRQATQPADSGKPTLESKRVPPLPSLPRTTIRLVERQQLKRREP